MRISQNKPIPTVKAPLGKYAQGVKARTRGEQFDAKKEIDWQQGWRDADVYFSHPSPSRKQIGAAKPT
jgi:hypothetical protein